MEHTDRGGVSLLMLGANLQAVTLTTVTVNFTTDGLVAGHAAEEQAISEADREERQTPRRTVAKTAVDTGILRVVQRLVSP